MNEPAIPRTDSKSSTERQPLKAVETQPSIGAVPLLAEHELPLGLGYDEPSRGLEDHKPIKRLIAWRRELRRYAVQTIAPRALDVHERMWRDHHYVPQDLIDAGAREGFYSGLLPKFLGGQGWLTVEFAAFMEEMCTACGGIALIYGANALGLSSPVFCFNPEVIRRLLKPLPERERNGDPALWAFAITEPGAGSDVEYKGGFERGSIVSHAEKVPGGYRLNAHKIFISNGALAEYVAVYAALDRKDPLNSWTVFAVPRTAKGYSVARSEVKMGQRASPASELVLEDVFVPEGDRLGPEGGGYNLNRMILSASRGPVGAIATGIARGAFEVACHHALHASAGDPGSIENEWVAHTLAHNLGRLRAMRLLYLDAATAFDRYMVPSRVLQNWGGRLGNLVPDRFFQGAWGQRMQRAGDRAFEMLYQRLEEKGKIAQQEVLASTAKWSAGDMAMQLCTEMRDIVAFADERHRLAVEKAFCDAKLTQIYEGTNQLNRWTVRENMMERPSGR